MMRTDLQQNSEHRVHHYDYVWTGNAKPQTMTIKLKDNTLVRALWDTANLTETSELQCFVRRSSIYYN